MAKTRVAIVGAGFSGLAAIKECLAEGLEPVCFEGQADIGGGWAYDGNPSHDGGSSVYAGTVLNSCRDTSAFTDFPLDPSRYGDYFSHTAFLQYLREYAEHFGLLKHIRFCHKVLECVPLEEGRWRVSVQQEGKDAEQVEFDALIAATGHLSLPRTPEFKGRETFGGEFMHSHYYRTPGRFEGKRVAIIGLGSSSVDIACEVAPQAKELHVVTKRGAWIIPRFVLGKPPDAWDSRASQALVPDRLNQWLLTKLLNLVEGKPPKELIPDHRLLEQNPTVRGDFVEKVRTGQVIIQRAEVESFTPTGLALSTGTTLDVDVIIAATGYTIETPFLPPDTLRSADTPPHAVDLYKLIMPLRHRNLFLLGFIELFGPLPPAAEAQARFVAALLAGRIPRPPAAAMAKAVAAMQALQARSFVRSPRHALTMQYIPYTDDLLAPLGAVPSFARLLGRCFAGNPLRAWRVLAAVWFGIPASAQWRLCGHGAKAELARETMLRISGANEKLSKSEIELLEKTKVMAGV